MSTPDHLTEAERLGATTTPPTTHTPGQWRAIQFDESQTVIVPVAPGPMIAIISVGEGCPYGLANVALFLAAPAMLAALKELVAELDNPELHDQIETGGMMLARQALARAESEG